MPLPYPDDQPFSIAKATTAPGLAGRRESVNEFAPMLVASRRLREALKKGAPNRSSLEHIGENMVRSAHSGQAAALQAAALLYTHNIVMSIDTPGAAVNVAEDIIRTLLSLGRRDLFRPITEAIHEACWTRWEWNAPDRAAWREEQETRAIDPVGHIPELDERCELEYQLARQNHSSERYDYAFAGEVAWRALGQALSQNPILRMEFGTRISPATHLADILEMYSDAIATIPDARRWAADLIVATVQQARIAKGFWDTPNNINQLIVMGGRLTDAEACSVMRRLNEFDRMNASVQENALITSLIEARPGLSLNDWLTRGIMHDLKVSGIDKGSRSRAARSPLEYPDDNPKALSDDEMLVTYFEDEGEIRLYDHVFNKIIGEVGLAGPLEISSSLKKVLQNMANRHKSDNIEALYPLIRVALEKIALTNVGQRISTDREVNGVAPGSPPGRARRL